MGMTPSVVPTNRFRFTCPTLNRPELYLRCVMRRYRHWRGEEIEGGCATCMRASKCAALLMIKAEQRGDKALFLDEVGTTLHRLPAEILEQTRRTQVMRSHGRGTGVDTAVLEALMRGDFNGVPGTTAIPVPGEPGPPVAVDHTKSAVSGPAPTKRSVATQAQTKRTAKGDLSGAADNLDANMASAINAGLAR